jgi:hypothetical protein
MVHQQTKTEQAPTSQPATPFPIGTAVRVLKGVQDPDFEHMPLGGWTGKVTDVKVEEDGIFYLVEWNAFTLQHMHPVYRRRCERDGLELTSTWLGANDLEIDPGEPPELEPPTDICPRPLDSNRLDDRIRAVFSLTTDDPLPGVTDATLRTFHEHLRTKLVLPITVEYSPGYKLPPPRSAPLVLMELSAPKDGDTTDGLLGNVEQGDQRRQLPLSDLETVAQGTSRQLLADYAFWFTSYGDPRAASERQQDLDAPETPETGLRTVFNAVSRCGLLGGAAGAAVGSVTATMEDVLFAMAVGAVTLAIVGYVAGTRYGFFFGKISRINSGPILGGIFGIIAGAVAGVVAGPLVIAYLGTIVGSIIGAILGQLLRLIHKRLPGPMGVGMAGAAIGPIIEAWIKDSDQALTGLMYGIMGGAAAGLLLSAGFFGALVLIEMKRDDQQ